MKVIPDEVEATPEPEILRMRLIIQNNRIKEELKAQGYTMGRLSKKIKLSYSLLSKVINLHRVPSENQIIAIAIALGKPIEYLFPDILLEGTARGLFQNRTKLLDEEQVKQITRPLQSLLQITDGSFEAMEKQADMGLLHKQIDEVLSTLTPREQRVLQLRFGLEDGRSRTGEEVAKEFGVTRERIYQIERKALRKLRHPSRSRRLKDYLD